MMPGLPDRAGLPERPGDSLRKSKGIRSKNIPPRRARRTSDLVLASFQVGTWT